MKGRTPNLRTRLNQATATTRRYTLCLYRDNWHAHCSSFNERTGLTKAWHTFPGMKGKPKVRTAAENIGLYIHTSNLDHVPCPFPSQRHRPPLWTTISAWLRQSPTPCTNHGRATNCPPGICYQKRSWCRRHLLCCTPRPPGVIQGDASWLDKRHLGGR